MTKDEALNKKAENARELGLDYEPVREDWGPGPHECHSLTAAPVQEPLTDDHIERIYHRYGGDMINCARAIERASQRQWVGLTDEEVRETISSVRIEPLFSYRHVARAIETKLKEKNT